MIVNFVANDSTRLDKFLKINLLEYSRSYIQKLIKNGNVELSSGEKIKDCDHITRIGVEYIVKLESMKENFISFDDINVKYQDNDLMIIDKPAGLVVHPGTGTNYTLVDILKQKFGNSSFSSIDPNRPGIVHRLDKDTTGLMVVAKNNIAHAYLSSCIEKRTLKRTYTAFVWGNPKSDTGLIKCNIGRKRGNSKVMVVKNSGKEAITRYSVIKRFGDIASMMNFSLETGRTHQIRVHALFSGFPIIGDKTYGCSKRNEKYVFENKIIDRHALHSSALAFLSLNSNNMIESRSDLPDDMKKLAKYLDFFM